MVTWVATGCQVGCSPKHGSTTAPRGFSSSCRGTARGQTPQLARCACTARLNPQKSLGFSRSLASNLWFIMFNLRQWTHQACHCIKPTALKKWLIVPPRTDPCRGPPLRNQTHQERLCFYQLFAYNICIYLHMHLRLSPGFSEGDFFLAHWAHCSGLSTPSGIHWKYVWGVS